MDSENWQALTEPPFKSHMVTLRGIRSIKVDEQKNNNQQTQGNVQWENEHNTKHNARQLWHVAILFIRNERNEFFFILFNNMQNTSFIRPAVQ